MSRIAITGCTSGIGAACARLFKAKGAHVTGFDIAEPTEGVDTFVRLDLSQVGAIASAVAQARGPFDAVLNIAGLPPLAGLEAAILAVNVTGARVFTEHMLGHIAPGGAIVNMASRAGHRWRDNIEQVKRLLDQPLDTDLSDFVRIEGIDAVRAYDLSKEAMIAWTMAATEPLLARGLRMNTVSPGAIETRLLSDFKAAFGPAVARNLARAGRPGTPDEVAHVAVFLASPESGWIKGTDIAVDGGIGAFVTAERLQLSAGIAALERG